MWRGVAVPYLGPVLATAPLKPYDMLDECLQMEASRGSGVDNRWVVYIPKWRAAIAAMIALLIHTPPRRVLEFIAVSIDIDVVHYGAAVSRVSQPRHVGPWNGCPASPPSTTPKIVWHNIVLPMRCVERDVSPILCASPNDNWGLPTPVAKEKCILGPKFW